MTAKQAYVFGWRLALQGAGLPKMAAAFPAEALAAVLRASPEQGKKVAPHFSKRDDPKDPPDNMRWSKSGPHGYDTLTTLGLTFPDISTYGL